MSSLKNYEIYHRKISNFLQALELKLEYKNYPEEGVYLPSQRKIIIDEDLSESEEIATLLHEIGHAIDMYFMTPKELEIQNQTYGIIYTKKYRRKHVRWALKTEKNAWATGRKIAEILKIRLGKWYDIEEKIGLDSYRTFVKP